MADFCTGRGAGCPADAKSTAVCRPAAGPCDVAERCNGVDDTCPADGLKPAATECGTEGDACFDGGTCTGGSIACPNMTPKAGVAGLLCAFDRSLDEPACLGQPVPPNVRALFTRARTLAEKTVGADARARKRALQQAAALLRRADKAVARAAKRKHQAVSADCAAALHGMLGDASARVLAAES